CGTAYLNRWARPGLRVAFISGPLPVARLLVARQDVMRSLPGREKIEVAKLLGEPHRLVDHALLLVVVADLDEAGKRKIFAQRMALKAVIGEQTPHVRMPGEQHAVEVVGFALEPVGARKHADDRRNRRRLADLDLHPDAQVLPGRKQVIDDVEAALAPRPVDGGDVDKAPELATLVVAQEGRDLHDVVRD